MLEAKIKVERLAISIILVLFIADLLPHPSLSPEIISATLSEMEDVIKKLAD
ncbi:MAG: hypothetical protein F6K42_26030 [Leptolyngbya sp. SIO1D8]|nr:hypothetical protein [Leptolyngbya sp. SIO1D8]